LGRDFVDDLGADVVDRESLHWHICDVLEMR
jgi:hypothetical protein